MVTIEMAGEATTDIVVDASQATSVTFETFGEATGLSNDLHRILCNAS